MKEVTANARPCFGLDTGTTNNVLVRLVEQMVYAEDPLKSLTKDIFKDAARWNSGQWSQLAELIVIEMIQRELFPIGIDAALSAAIIGKKRMWESWAGGFSTPSSLDPLPTRGGSQQKYWFMLARLWTEIVHLLVIRHGWRLWDGEPIDREDKLIVEVYPRISWMMFAASSGYFITDKLKSSESKDGVLKMLDIGWSVGRRNDHLRDAAICALTVSSVLRSKGGYMGEPLQAGPNFLRGGGIAIPCITRNGA